MTIIDLMSMFTDWEEQRIRIERYTVNDCKTVYEGTMENVPDKYHYEDVVNIDNLTKDCVLSIAYYNEEE